MTLLVGDNNFTGYTGAGPTSTDGGYLAATPFIAPTTGLVSSLNAWLTPGSATTFAMGLYDSVLQKLSVSQPITAGTGLNAFPISAPVVAGRAYQLLLAPTSAGTFKFGIDGASPAVAYKVANGGSFPQQLGGPTTTAYGAPAFYVDGDSRAQILATSGTYQSLLS